MSEAIKVPAWGCFTSCFVSIMAPKFELPFTQTSTIVAFICTILIVVALSPFGNLGIGEVDLLNTIVRLVHLTSFSTWLGVQVWVTFFAGLTMYRYLPRHTFGYIQGKLFPKYFLLGTILSSVTLLTFLFDNPFNAWDAKQKIQGYSLLIGLLMALSNLLYLEPQTTRCTMDKHKLEKEVQAGQAIGKVEEDKLIELRKNPTYNILEKRFISLHTYSAIANLLSLAVQVIHLWCLSCYLTSV